MVHYNEQEITKLRSRELNSQWEMRDEEQDWDCPEKKEETKADKYDFLKIQGKTKESVNLFFYFHFLFRLSWQFAKSEQL